jgi:hypothetical protein
VVQGLMAIRSSDAASATAVSGAPAVASSRLEELDDQVSGLRIERCVCVYVRVVRAGDCRLRRLR